MYFSPLKLVTHRGFQETGVAGYDHHCPWMGTCVGEKNRAWFLIYISIQYYEVVWGFGIFIKEVTRNWEEIKLEKFLLVLNCVLGTGLLFFVLFLSSLVFYHLYLVSVNLSTWEDKSWRKISYLKEFPRKLGSPFSKGLVKNWKTVFFNHLLAQSQFVYWNFTEDFKKRSNRKFA